MTTIKIQDEGNLFVECYMTGYSWYFGEMSRKDAEEVLMQPSIDHGSFLIRKSENRPGEYSLSLKNLNEVKHLKISKQDDESFYLTPKETFTTISELVAHYNKQTLPIAKYQHLKLKSVCLIQPHGVDLSEHVREGQETSRKSEVHIHTSHLATSQ